MNERDYVELVAQFDLDRGAVTEDRRDRYAEEGDVLAFFKEAAEMLGIGPLQAWGVLAFKHFKSILRQARDLENADALNVPKNERLTTNFEDAANYVSLGVALFVEGVEDRPAIDPREVGP